ncbi:hypothetical protein [Synechococcus elongatus]|uniref:Uncharacterized protein n=2 Tax=Synechococcus elongatus TaxID=32046 RepID=A0AAN1QQP2_SYNEL|nr:hypothetical protein [Synechococcus elongatus]
MESFERAQPRDAASIAALIDAQLRPQGVTVAGIQTPDGLQLRLQGVTVEQQVLLEPYLREVLRRLQIPMSSVQIQGCTTQGTLVWQTRLRLADIPETSRSTPVPATTPMRSRSQSAIAARSRRGRLLVLMLLAAIAGVATAFWQTSRQLSSPAPTEQISPLTNRLQ